MYQQQTQDQRQKQSFTQSMKVLILSLLNVLWYLLDQSITILIRPSITTLSKVQQRAQWKFVWILFLTLMVIMVVINWLAMLIPSAGLHTIATFTFGQLRPFALLPSPLTSIIFVLASFLIGLGTAYLFSKLAKGQGTFVAHTYLLSLCTVPLITISGILLLLPMAGVFFYVLVSLLCALFIYRLMLHAITIMAVHHLRARTAILITLIIPMLIIFIWFVVLTEGTALEGLIDVNPFGRKKKSKI